MKYLFGAEGEALLHALAAQPCLFAFDFDGTLSPIVLRPDRARIEPGTARLLERLCRLAPVAVITGRSVADVRRRIPGCVPLVVGNHGSESPEVPEALRERWHADCRGWLRQLHAGLVERLDPAAVIVEDKGVSLSVHYRLARDRAAAEQALLALFETLQPAPRIVAGKCVFNVVPADAPNKRDALAALVRRAGARAALFAGDDVTDEDVFVDAPADWLTLRVEHSPDSAARWFVHGQPEIAMLLMRLVRLLDPEAPPS